MYLLAISGGPDSMFLLNRYKNKNIIVAHVNYNKRNDSNNDESIVKLFCKKHNIPCEVLNIKMNAKNNFQAWARKIRYDFFKEIYDKNNCKWLITAHHKDDFLETAIMQQESRRTPRFFGIRRKNRIYGMKVFRPYINIYWKKYIIKSNQKNNIIFAIDSSNKNFIYKRNEIRDKLRKKTEQEKKKMFSWYMMSNKILKKKFKRVDCKVKKIVESNHSLRMYRLLDIDTKEIIYEIVHKELGEVKLSSKKIKALIDFIQGKEGNKKFIINNKSYILKKNKKLRYNVIK